MTEGQQKYQTLMENQRHNREMEMVSRSEALTKQGQLELANRQLDWDIQLADYEKPAQRAANIGKSFESFAKGIAQLLPGAGLFKLFG